MGACGGGDDGVPHTSCIVPAAMACADFRGPADRIAEEREKCPPERRSAKLCDRTGALGGCEITFTSSRGPLQTIVWLWPTQTLKTEADAQAECLRRDQTFVPVQGPLPPLPP